MSVIGKDRSSSERIDKAKELLQKAINWGHRKSCRWGEPESDKIPGGPYLFVCRCNFQYISGALCELALTTKRRRYKNKIERKGL